MTHKPEDLFNDGLSVFDRTALLLHWFHKEGLRPSGDNMPANSAAAVKQFWRLEALDKPRTALLVFLQQNPPAELSDVKVVVFRQKVGEDLIHAYEHAERGAMTLQEVLSHKSFAPLRDMIKTHGGQGEDKIVARRTAAKAQAAVQEPEALEV